MLLIFAIRNANEFFLKHAFKDPGAIFNSILLNDDEVKEEFMNVLYEGSNIEIILNLLIYV